MKRQKIGRTLLFLFLVFTLAFPMTSMDAMAASNLKNGDTGLTGDIDVTDTISMPVRILDYEADGMLFEYAESNGWDGNDTDEDGVSGKDPKVAKRDFGATFASDYAVLTSVKTGEYGYFFSSYTSQAIRTGTYANYMRITATGTSTTQNPFEYDHSRAGSILPNDLGGLSLDSIRYLVLVYRSNVTNGKIGFFVERADAGRDVDDNKVKDFDFVSEGATNWTYAVYDLKQGNLANTWSKYGNATAIWTTWPMDKSGEYIDIAHAALFADAERAEMFGEYAITDGSMRGDNRAFGLLRGSRTEDSNDQVSGTGVLDNTATVTQVSTYGSTITELDYSSLTSLGYTLLGTFGDNGIANVGLLEPELQKYEYIKETTDENGDVIREEIKEYYPKYKQEVVEYFADLLKSTLEIPERTADGWKNYRYVEGTASPIYGGTDLATALRNKIQKREGSYAEALGKKLVGTWEEVNENITSYHDAAYFLLNSIFVDGSYNERQDDYDYLVLSSGIDSKTNKKTYIFDGGFTTSATPADAEMAINYESKKVEIGKDENGESIYGKGIIQNTSAAGKTEFPYEGGNYTTLNPFLPITDKNNKDLETKSVYYQDPGVINTATTGDTYVDRNFNFVMVSEGEFVYHADEELYFEFSGDDDVYLFINGQLVLDIGSAHSIDNIRIELNDYVNAAKAGTLGSDERNQDLNLMEGVTYDIKFYYMERHGYGSNIRINTNIRLTDPSMETQKPAWQDEVKLDYGNVIDGNKIVEYGFSITNNGQEHLFNIEFLDKNIGVKLNPTDGLTVTGDRVFDVNGGTLDATDLTAVLSHPEYEDIIVTFSSNTALKKFLENLTSSEVIENSGGLWVKSTLLIRGIGYKLSEDEVKAGLFDNTVNTIATNNTKSKTLTGQAKMRVCIPADPMYYQWAGRDLKVTLKNLIDDILAAAVQTDNTLNGKVSNLETENVNKVEFITSSGNPIKYESVSMDNSYNLTINYPKAGSNVFYLMITYNSNKNTVKVPVLVNVTSVQDSVFVLDYGLTADLTDRIIDISSDMVVVPGRDTEYFAEGITATQPSYSPNNISFSTEGDGNLECEDGTYAWDGKNLSYQPNEFMDGADSVYTAIRVKEKDFDTKNPIGTVDINEEVEMYKSVKTIPATVVYYEDDFPAITYKGQKNTIVEDVTCHNLKQSSDQKEEYGHDRVYEVASDVSSSGGVITTIDINDASVAAEFDFKGTGFEIISRTDAVSSGIMEILVYKTSDYEENKENLENAEILRRIPVITEYDNQANTSDDKSEVIYQVPVIRVNNLEHDNYTVLISGVPTYDFSNWNPKDPNSKPVMMSTKLYIDGLRIYQPLGATNTDYTLAENGATYVEIRKLIASGDMGVVSYSNENGLTLSTETSTWTENRVGHQTGGSETPKDETDDTVDFVYNEVNSVNDYLTYGPNNEVYLNADSSREALVFYVKEAEGSKVESRSLQIAVRGIDAGLFLGQDAKRINAPISYYTSDNTWQPIHTLTSWTEQYYKINYAKCPKTEDGYYQVVVVLDEGMASFSSLKYNGLTLKEAIAEKATVEYENGILKEVVAVFTGRFTNTGTNAVEAVGIDASSMGKLLDEYSEQSGTFELTKDSRVFIVSDTAPTGELLQTVQLAARQLAEEVDTKGNSLNIVYGNVDKAKDGDIIVAERDVTILNEGYKLNVSGTATISYSDFDGLLYGFNNLQKFIRYAKEYGNSSILNGFVAKDAPDTKERTVMLDTGRKYYTAEWIKNFIKQMSWMGYNSLEVHFSEDGGFRADIWDENYYVDGYYKPENDFSWLCGSKTQYWVYNGNKKNASYDYKTDPNANQSLTAAELIDIINVAKEYHIDIIPSFDSPAHMDYLTWKFEQKYKSDNNYSFKYNGTMYYAKNTSNAKGCINYTGVTGESAPTWYYAAVNIKDTVSRAFTFALYKDIADFFAYYAGSTKFSIGADEVGQGSSVKWTYAEDFPGYINDLNALLKGKGYTMRMFNDFLGTTVYSTTKSFDSDIEIMYWNSPFNPNNGTTYGNENKTQPASYFVNQGRIIYNCIQTHTYYVLRVANASSVSSSYKYMDARNPENQNWTFYHSTEDRIYNEWKPNNVSEIGQYSESVADIPSANLGGAYFLIWNDYAALNTEAEVWNGVRDTTGTNNNLETNYYSLFDRMWSNTVKMWNSDIDDTLAYDDYAAIRSNFGYFPGFTSCSAKSGLAAKSDELVSAALLESLETEVGDAPKDVNGYELTSYEAYLEAYYAAKELLTSYTATEARIIAAIEALNKAEEGLRPEAELELTVKFQTERYTTSDSEKPVVENVVSLDNEPLTIIYKIPSTGDVNVYLEGLVGFSFSHVEGNALSYVPLESGSTTCGNLVGKISGNTEVIVWLKNEPSIGYLDELLRTAIEENDRKYTSESWNAYVEAKVAATTLRSNVVSMASTGKYTVTQKDLDVAAERYKAAKAALVEATSKTEILSVKCVTEEVVAGKMVGLIVLTTPDVSTLTVDGIDELTTCTANVIEIEIDGETVIAKEWHIEFPTEEYINYIFTYTVRVNDSVTDTVEVKVVSTANEDLLEEVNEELIDEPTPEDVVENLIAA